MQRTAKGLVRTTRARRCLPTAGSLPPSPPSPQRSAIPTRREIYLHVRSTPGDDGVRGRRGVLASPERRKAPSRPARGGWLPRGHPREVPVGRSREAFKALPAADGGSSDPTVELLGRRDDLLVSLLGEALTLLGPDEAERMAERVGEKYGRALAERMEPGEGQRSLRAAMHTWRTPSPHRASPPTQRTGVRRQRWSQSNAHSVRRRPQHPVICAVDRGMVRGLLAGLCGEQVQGSTPVVLSSRARGDDACAALV